MDELIREQIGNEQFNLEFTRDGVFISHPTWSLVGYGNTPHEAKVDLMHEAELARSTYVHCSIEDLTNSACRFRQWLIENT